jgi:hypothetical protein
MEESNAMMKRVLLFLGTAILAYGLQATSASADTQAPLMARSHASVSDLSTTAAGCPVVRYGYSGEASCSSYILDVNWNPSGTARLETFLISPTRRIYHAWPGSGGWQLMPGNGRADDTGSAYWSGGDRVVSVYVNGTGYFCTTDPAGSAGWNGWRRC